MFGLCPQFEGHTVPQPFSLQTEVRSKDNRHKEKLDLLRAEQLKECTFRPAVNPYSGLEEYAFFE